MSGSLLDPERVVTSNRAPGDACRAQIVERDVFALSVARKELGTPHASGLKVLAQENGAVLVVGHPEYAIRAASRGLLTGSMKACNQGRELRLHGDSPGRAGLGRLDLARPPVDRLGDVDDAVVEIDVVPSERGKLIGPRVRIDGERIKRAERGVDGLALDKPAKLARV